MKKLIIVLIAIFILPVMGICEQIYLGDDPNPHARWARERDGYTIIYSLENLLEREEAERKAMLEEIQKQMMMEAQEKQEKIQL